MPRIRLLASSLALAICSVTAAQAQQFDSVVVFGDSLSDDGNIAAFENANFGTNFPAGTSFTTNPDPVSVNIIAGALGYKLTDSLSGGSDYAFGGSCVQQFSATFNCVNDPTPNDSLSISNMVNAYVASGKVDPNALFTMWGGANDLFTYAELPITAQQAGEGVALSSATEVGLINELQKAGARNILVFNLPNVAVTPDASAEAQEAYAATLAGGGSKAQAQAAAASVLSGLTDLSLIYNNVLNQGLAGHTGIIPVNVFGLVNEVIAHPGTYGFTNVTTPACQPFILNVTTSLECGPAGSGAPFQYAPGTDQSYFFADGVHPTGAGHALLAEAVLSEIAAPAYVSMLAETPLQTFETQNRAINEQLESDMGGNRADGTFRSFANGDYSHQRYDSTATSPATTSEDDTLVIGGDYFVDRNISFGVSSTFSHQKASFEGGGGFQNNEPMIAGWGMWHTQDYYLSLLGSLGQLNFNGIERVIPLGPDLRTETGSTDGSHIGMQAEGGYEFHFGDMNTGPFASLSHQRIRVGSYNENGDDSTTMYFDRQERDSTLWRVGWELSGDNKLMGNTFRPYARVAYEHEADNDPRYVTAGVVGMNGTFSLQGFEPDSSYWTGELGLSADVGANMTAFASYDGHFGDTNERVDSFNLGFKWVW